MLRPYVLIIDGKHMGFFKYLSSALMRIKDIKLNVMPSSVRVYEETSSGQRLVHEE